MDPDDQELEKAKEVSTWMEKNKELLQNITYLRLRGLSLKTIPPRVYELLTGLRRIEFCQVEDRNINEKPAEKGQKGDF